MRKKLLIAMDSSIHSHWALDYAIQLNCCVMRFLLSNKKEDQFQALCQFLTFKP